MRVIVGGREYEIDGLAYGTVPAWRLIKQNEQPMTHELFDKLPDADKRALIGHVQQYINNLKGG